MKNILNKIYKNIRNNNEISLEDALMLSENKACISLDINGKISIEKYSIIHPEVVDENIKDYELSRIAKYYKDTNLEREGGLRKLL